MTLLARPSKAALNLPGLVEVREQLCALAVEQDGIDGDLLAESRTELVRYLQDHAARLSRSLRIVAGLAPAGRDTRILELGAAPYFFSGLVTRYLGSDLVGVNVRAGAWPEAGEPPVRETVRLRQPGATGAPQVFELPVIALNIEKDPLPFPDRSFDVVLLMETLEHLVYSPSHVLAEAGRVLKPGGALLVSTPNVLDLMKTLKLLFNRPVIGFPYSGYGIYGRHNREYTPRELARLVAACGFSVERLWLENPYVPGRPLSAYGVATRVLAGLSALPLPYLRNKRQYIYLLARATGRERAAYPQELYLFRHLYPEPGRKDRRDADGRA